MKDTQQYKYTIGNRYHIDNWIGIQPDRNRVKYLTGEVILQY